MSKLSFATRWLVLVCLCGLPIVAGCKTRTLDDERIYYPSYYWRHWTKIMDDCHYFRIDIDRTVFGLEDVPVEQYR